MATLVAALQPPQKHDVSFATSDANETKETIVSKVSTKVGQA
jgi:hypothetical protein